MQWCRVALSLAESSVSSTPFPSVFFPLLPPPPPHRPRQGFVFILSRNAGGARPIYMTKISLIPLTSKCPPQTVFISGIEIRYANCLRHQCHLLLAELRLCGCAAVRRPALVFLLQDWTTVRFWCFLFFFLQACSLWSGKSRFAFYCERTWNVWLITDWRASLKWAAHDLATQLDRWYRQPLHCQSTSFRSRRLPLRTTHDKLV